MRGRANLFLVLAVLSGLAAAYGVYAYLRGLQETYRAAGDFRPVVVAREKIAPQTQITEKMIGVEEVPVRYVHEQAATRKEDVLGRFAGAVIYPGEQILKTRIAAAKDPAQGFAFLVSSGKRAATIAVNEVTGVAGLLRPGDRVDIVGTADVPAGNAKVTVTSLLVQNVTVLAVNQTAEASQVKSGGKPVQTQTVTLEVTPQQAQVLVLAAERGSLHLLLRAPGDGAEVALPSARLEHLVR